MRDSIGNDEKCKVRAAETEDVGEPSCTYPYTEAQSLRGSEFQAKGRSPWARDDATPKDDGEPVARKEGIDGGGEDEAPEAETAPSSARMGAPLRLCVGKPTWLVGYRINGRPKTKQWRREVFLVAQRLKGMGFTSLADKRLRKDLLAWFGQMEEAGHDGGDLVAELGAAFAQVNGEGLTPEVIQAGIESVPLPEEAWVFKRNRGMMLLTRICRRLADWSEDGTFYLSCRMAAQLVGGDPVPHWTTANGWLHSLAGCGVLEDGDEGSRERPIDKKTGKHKDCFSAATWKYIAKHKGES